jgi:hypothetical protein
MRVVRPSLLPFAAAALSVSVVSCHQPQSVLLVEVAGDVTLTPTYLNVTVAPTGAGPRDFQITASGGAVLPASFTVQLPATITGPVTVSITAVDAQGGVLGYGIATQKNLDVGGQTIVVVTLMKPDNVDVTMRPDAGQSRPDAHPVADARADGPRDAARLDGSAGARDGAHDGARRDAGGGQ